MHPRNWGLPLPGDQRRSGIRIIGGGKASLDLWPVALMEGHAGQTLKLKYFRASLKTRIEVTRN